MTQTVPLSVPDLTQRPPRSDQQILRGDITAWLDPIDLDDRVTWGGKP